MRKCISLFLSLVLVLSIFLSVPFVDSPFKITAEAASKGSCGTNVSWTYSDGVLKITGSGKIKDYLYFDAVPWYSQIESINSVVIGSGVTRIGDCAFGGCINLTSVTIPDSVKSIGSEAFYDCEKLKSVKIPGNVTSIDSNAFCYCKSLKSVTIPKSVKVIDYSAFYGCEKLATIKLPDTLEVIGSNAFLDTAYYNNNSNWTKGVLYIGNHIITGRKVDPETYENISSVSGACTVKAGTKTIADCAFMDCKKLTSISLPASLVSIGYWGFDGCTALTKITVNSDNKYYSSSNGVLFNKKKTELIKYSASKSSTSYSVPKTVKTIWANAFYGAKKLTSVTVNDGVTTIGYDAFGDCSELKTIKLPDSIYNMGGYVFDGTAYYKNKKNWSGDALYVGNHLVSVDYDAKGSFKVKDGTKSLAACSFSFTDIKSVTLPKSLIGIGEIAFGFLDITSIKIPSNVKYIGPSAFAYTSLKSVTIPSKVKTIHNGTFMYCTSLASVKIPDSVTKIEDYAFNSCAKLTSVTIPASVKTIGKKAFGYGQFTLEDQENGEYSKIKGFTIRGVAGSAAEKYAKANGFTFKKVSKPGTVKLGKVSNTSKGVQITWSKVSGAESYVVYRKSGSGSYKAIKTVTGTSYTDTTAKSGTKYTYTVRAKNIAGLGSYDKTGLTKLYLKEPTLKSVSSGKSGVTIKWNKVTGAKGYYVYRKTGSGDWQKIATVKSGSTVSYLNKSAKKGKTYSYTVRAYNGKYISSRNTTGLKIKDKY